MPTRTTTTSSAMSLTRQQDQAILIATDDTPPSIPSSHVQSTSTRLALDCHSSTLVGETDPIEYPTAITTNKTDPIKIDNDNDNDNSLLTLPSIPLSIHGDPTIHEEQSMTADAHHKTSVDDCKEETHHKDTWESIAGTWEFIYVDYFTDNPSDEDNILHDEEIVFESCIAPSLSNDEMHGEHTPRQVHSTTFTEANGERLHATSVQKLRDRDKEHITSIEETIKLHWLMQHQRILYPSGPSYKYKRKDIATPSLLLGSVFSKDKTSTLRLDAMMYTKTMLNPFRYTYGERAMHTIPSLTKKNHLLERKDYLEIQFLSLAKLQYLEIQFSSSAKLAGFIILVRPSICFAKIMMSRESEDSGIRNLNIQMGLAKIMRSHFQEESGTQNPKFTKQFYLGFCPLMMSYLHDNFRIQNVAFVQEFHAHF